MNFDAIYGFFCFPKVWVIAKYGLVFWPHFAITQTKMPSIRYVTYFALTQNATFESNRFCGAGTPLTSTWSEKEHIYFPLNGMLINHMFPPPPPQEIRCTHLYTMRVISLAQERNAGTNVPGPSTPIGNFPGSKPKLEAKTQRIIVRTLAYKQSILFIWVCEVLKI